MLNEGSLSKCVPLLSDCETTQPPLNLSDLSLPGALSNLCPAFYYHYYCYNNTLSSDLCVGAIGNTSSMSSDLFGYLSI